MLLQYIEDLNLNLSLNPTSTDDDSRPSERNSNTNPSAPTHTNDTNDVEASLLAELSELQSNTRPSHPSSSSPYSSSSGDISLVTLDIPCVSFARLSPRLDPIQLVYSICRDAAARPDRMRSRYIKRLTPVSVLRKTLSNGLDECCEEVLPGVFGALGDAGSADERRELDGRGERADNDNDNDNGEGRGGVPSTANTDASAAAAPPTPGWKYAIRPTIRNNSKLDRDKVIRTVAARIEGLGQGRHKVDLKGYEKLVLVDVYRNVVGMAVVGDVGELEGRLRRFNLSEIYAQARA